MPIQKKPALASKPLPMQDVYDTLRTARMNERYYGERLAMLQRWNLILEVLAAVGTSSAVGTLALWSATGTKTVPLILGAIATVLTVIKPIIGLSKRIERYSKLWASYNSVFNTMRQVVADVRRNGGLRDEMERVYAGAYERIDQLSTDDDTAPNRKTVLRIQNEVDEEFPPNRLGLSRSAEASATEAAVLAPAT